MKKKIRPNYYKIEKSKFTYIELNHHLQHFEKMKCYSFNKKNNKPDFDKVANLIPPSFVQKEEVQSIDMILSGITNQFGENEFYITLITGRMDKDKITQNQMYDYDAFNIGPDTISRETYYFAQSFDFKDETGKRTTDIYSTKNLSDINDKKNELYSYYLTGVTSQYTIEEYENQKNTLLNIHHQSFKEIKKKIFP